MKNLNKYINELNRIVTELKNNNEHDKVKKLRYYKFTEYNNVSSNIDEYLSSFTDTVSELFPDDTDINSVDFMLYELLTNVYKHSRFKRTYLQIITPDDENIEIRIFDNGIGIHGSFKNASIASTDDSEAIYEAINGKTSDKEKYGLRGRGLNSTARLTTLGFNGEMIIASGNGFCVITKEGAKTFINHDKIKGTFVILKIENKKINNIYSYLKFENINKIKEAKHD